MKFVIALALFAVAFADEVQVASLGEAPVPAFQMPDIRPLMVPQNVLDAIKNYQPVLRDFPVEDESLNVKFVDAPIEVPAESVVADEGLEVHFVDAPLEVAEELSASDADVMRDAPLAPLEDESLNVRFVDAPIEVPAESVVADEGLEIHFDEAPLEVAQEFAVPDAVRIAEAPLPAVEYDNAAPENAEASVPVVVYYSEIFEAPLALPVAEYDFAAPEPVMLPEAPLPVVEGDFLAPEPVRIAEALLPVVEGDFNAPEPVRIAEAPLPAVENAEIAVPAVEPVKVAVPHFPGKQFDDPRLR